MIVVRHTNRLLGSRGLEAANLRYMIVNLLIRYHMISFELLQNIFFRIDFILLCFNSDLFQFKFRIAINFIEETAFKL